MEPTRAAEEQKVLLTGAGLEVVLQLVALVAVAGEGPRGADADVLAVVFALGTQVHSCTSNQVQRLGGFLSHLSLTRVLCSLRMRLMKTSDI